MFAVLKQCSDAVAVNNRSLYIAATATTVKILLLTTVTVAA